MDLDAPELAPAPSGADAAAAVEARREPVIQVRGVTKEYRTEGAVTDALQGIDLDIVRGEMCAVMGPSGSGKSTLLHIMGGLDTPTSGTVHLDGEDISTLSDRQMTHVRRRELGFVFQFFNLIPVLTAWENVALPRVVDGEPRRRYGPRVDELLALVGISDRGHHLPSQLSGGQQQRVAIARALVAEPAVIFADEPTGNLDSTSGQEVLRLLRRLVDVDGQTVVIITHDPGAAAVCDRIVFLRDGWVVDQLYPTGSGADRAQAVFAWLQVLEAPQE